MDKMLLAIDIGNTNIALGVYDRGKWLAHWRVRTVVGKTADEYAMLLQNLLRGCAIPQERLGRVVLASVVPPLTDTFSEVCSCWLGSPLLVLGPGVRTGLDIRTDHPSEVGADLVAGAVAAYSRFQESCIVVDFSTATAFVAVAAPGAIVGVAIAPGLRTGAEGLAGRAAQLPNVPLSPPTSALGKNTVHAMQAGLILGHAALVDGLIRRIREELGGTARVVATGEWASLIAPLAHEIEAVDPWLTLDGLRLISLRNPERSTRHPNGMPK